jgi:phospholipase/lecithinase/hemolysin
MVSLAAGLFLIGTAEGGEITGIVSFGDSLSDEGNYYAATGGVSPPTADGYAQGEFTNGLNWVRYLAQDLGVAAPMASVNGGTDYAYGGAMTGNGTTVSTFGPGTAAVPNIGQQIADYLGSQTPTAGQLFTIWGGANDVLNGGQTDPRVLLQNIGTEITTLAMAGAKQFLVGNLPPLNLTPVGATLSPVEQAGLAQFSYYFNVGLKSEAASLASALGVKINVLDVYSLFNDAVANPGKYGFTNVTDPAFLSNPSGDGHLFWDTIHPTTQADQFIGNLAAQTVPEASSMMLFASALMAMGARARWRWSRSNRRLTSHPDPKGG